VQGLPCAFAFAQQSVLLAIHALQLVPSAFAVAQQFTFV
jgi:hypothetical protein